MDETLLKKLKDWRRNTANLEGVELFRVFANKVLENIAEVKPKNKEPFNLFMNEFSEDKLIEQTAIKIFGELWPSSAKATAGKGAVSV